jgi:hypothetical protein
MEDDDKKAEQPKHPAKSKGILAHAGEVFHGVLSNASLAGLGKIFGLVTGKIQAMMDGHGNISKRYVNHSVNQVVRNVLSDLDGADGKFDGQISKEVLRQKGQNLLTNVSGSGGLSVFSALPEDLKKQVTEMFKNPATGTLSLNELYKKLTDNLHEKTSTLFVKFDSNHNYVITREEVKATMAKMEKMAQEQEAREKAAWQKELREKAAEPARPPGLRLHHETWHPGPQPDLGGSESRPG